MSSFKAAQLIADSGKADKVIFVIDRIELGTQSAREYRNFSAEDEAIQETENTDALVGKMKSPDVADTLIVSSIQKLGIMAEEGNIRPVDLKKINQKRIVFIVDECHRSTFGETFQQIKATFPTAMFFGFTGTPIQDENQRHQSTTTDIFGDELHRYSIADGIRDGNVLGFDPYKVMTYKDKELRQKVALDYVDASSVEEVMNDPEKERVFNKVLAMPMAGHRKDDGSWEPGIEDLLPKTQYLTEEHMNAVVDDIVDGWLVLSKNHKFHAIFTVPSIPQAIKYYRIFKEKAPQLKVTALFDPSLPNDNPDKTIFKENALAEIITDYKDMFGQSYTIAEHAKFKKDLSNRLAHKKPYIGLEQPAQRDKRLDLLIVVSQMLTGFDSKWVNTLYIDKVMYYEELIQAFSRTNRLYSHDEKPFGVIKYYSYPHTMEYNIQEAVKLYSGNKPLGLFVSKLDVNLSGMNQKFREIEQLFVSAHIENFNKLPDATALRGRFAVLFREYNVYLDAAKVQGFNWKKLTYRCPNGEEITVNHDEITYNTLVQRYKELFNSTGGNGGGQPGEDLPYDLDPHLSEIDTGKIDADYMNHNFERYIKALEQPNVSKEELNAILNDLSASFASLPQEEQAFAEIFLHDVQSANITLEPGKTFRDYITDYMTTEKDRQVDCLVHTFGLDRQLLRQMLNLSITEQNINEFNRFTRLKESVDKTKAKAYFESKYGQTISLLKVNIEINNLLKRFILEGVYDVDTDVFNPSTKVIQMYPQIGEEGDMMMAAEDIFIYGSIPVDLPYTNRKELANGNLDLVLMYAIGSNARQKTEAAGKIALGIKEGILKDEQMAAYKSIKYLMFHYWSNPKAYLLIKEPELVGKDEVPSEYLIRMEKDAVKYLLLDYDPQQSVDLGNVNIDAIEEYDRVSERYNYLINQQNDLLKAEDTLLLIIKEMDEVMETEFTKTFKIIRENFKQTFKDLFKGGTADLKLTDPNNILETGIDIVASPPGKSLKSISLLSGGEKTFTAISLLFAILKSRPVPFCILDEVEAALDEVNVDSFGSYLKQLQSKTQFILITHKKRTMEYADILYGITMQESGVSKLVSVKLEEVK